MVEAEDNLSGKRRALSPTAFMRDPRRSILILLIAVTALNYLDRQNLPVVVSELQRSIGLTNAQYSSVQSLFLLAYGCMYLGGGIVMDYLGTRVGYTLIVVWWSLANLAHGFVNGFPGLAAARFLLGAGEGGGFPGSAKTVSEWYSPQERSFAFGLFNAGSSIGAVIAPPFIAAVVYLANWRWVFILTGLLGFVWASFWWIFYRSPREGSPKQQSQELQLSYTGRKSWMEVPPVDSRYFWRTLLWKRQTWGLIAAKLTSDSAWYFLIFWIPKYLGDVRHLNIKQIGYYAWIPYAAAGLGSYLGGWLSSFLVRHNVSLDKSRKSTLGIAACLMPSMLLIAASPLALAIVFFSFAMFGHQFWSTIMQTLPVDMFPSSLVGSVSGLLGAVGSFGGMIFNLLVGFLLVRFGTYNVIFGISGVLHPIAFCIILLVVRNIAPVVGSHQSAAFVQDL